jgi:hypothetical protein
VVAICKLVVGNLPSEIMCAFIVVSIYWYMRTAEGCHSQYISVSYEMRRRIDETRGVFKHKENIIARNAFVCHISTDI